MKWAIVFAGLLISASILIVGRYEVEMHDVIPVRLDNWTGQIVYCAVDLSNFPEVRNVSIAICDAPLLEDT